MCNPSVAGLPSHLQVFVGPPQTVKDLRVRQLVDTTFENLQVRQAFVGSGSGRASEAQAVATKLWHRSQGKHVLPDEAKLSLENLPVGNLRVLAHGGAMEWASAPGYYAVLWTPPKHLESQVSGWVFPMNADHVLESLGSDGCRPGAQFDGEFIWVRNGGHMRLVRVGSKWHEVALKAEQSRNVALIPAKKWVRNTVYLTRTGRLSIYLGKVDHRSWSCGGLDEVEELQFVSLNQAVQNVDGQLALPNTYPLSTAMPVGTTVGWYGTVQSDTYTYAVASVSSSPVSSKPVWKPNPTQGYTQDWRVRNHTAQHLWLEIPRPVQALLAREVAGLRDYTSTEEIHEAIRSEIKAAADKSHHGIRKHNEANPVPFQGQALTTEAWKKIPHGRWDEIVRALFDFEPTNIDEWDYLSSDWLFTSKTRPVTGHIVTTLPIRDAVVHWRQKANDMAQRWSDMGKEYIRSNYPMEKVFRWSRKDASGELDAIKCLLMMASDNCRIEFSQAGAKFWNQSLDFVISKFFHVLLTMRGAGSELPDAFDATLAQQAEENNGAITLRTHEPVKQFVQQLYPMQTIPLDSLGHGVLTVPPGNYVFSSADHSSQSLTVSSAIGDTTDASAPIGTALHQTTPGDGQ